MIDKDAILMILCMDLPITTTKCWSMVKQFNIP